MLRSTREELQKGASKRQRKDGADEQKSGPSRERNIQLLLAIKATQLARGPFHGNLRQMCVR